ncbi:hypothetical protein D3C78_1886110 [compost metagenome]
MLGGLFLGQGEIGDQNQPQLHGLDGNLVLPPPVCFPFKALLHLPKDFENLLLPHCLPIDS